MRGPAVAIGGRRLQACRSRLLVQGFDHPPGAPEGAAKTAAGDHAGAIAGRLQTGVGRAGRKAVVFKRPILVASKCANVSCRCAVSARPLRYAAWPRTAPIQPL